MPVVIEERRQSGFKPPVPPPPFRDDDGGGDGKAPGFPISRAQLGVWILLAAVIMLFAGLSSAYIVLRGAPDWQSVELPSILWSNTLVLLASSLTIELARKAIDRGRADAMKRWLVVSGGLGLVFLAGQLVAWGQLAESGVFLQTTLHSSFLYVLTSIHAVHLMGGLGAMAFVLTKAFQNRYSARDHEHVRLCGLYWHFMDGIWLYLFGMLILA